MTYAESQAETIILNAVNSAVVKVLGDNKIEYDDIVNLSRDEKGYVTSLEINIVKINYLKSLISNTTSNIVEGKEFYSTSIPIGTFFDSGLFTGIGPRVSFKMQLTSTSIVDFGNDFTSEGINQVLHKIIINIDTKGTIIMKGYTDTFSVSTSAIAAQTVIVGVTPDAYTNVLETDGNNTAGLINDYAGGKGSNHEYKSSGTKD